MANFSYKVIKNDRRIKGTITAPDIEMAKDLLKKCGCDVLSIQKQFFTFETSGKLTQKELINFFSTIASMDRVGTNILQSLEMMKDDASIDYNLQHICEKIYFYVANGLSLSEACQKASGSFTHDYIGLIKIAESTGNYAKIFDQIVEYVKWSYEIKVRVKRAIRGPIATICFVVAMIIGLSEFILPKILDFINHFNIETPAYTLALVAFATFVKTKWMFIVGGVLSILLLIKLSTLFSEEFDCKVDKIKLKIPVFGQLMVKLDTSRFISFFSLMYNSGADIIETLDNVANIVVNRHFRSRILVIKQQIMDGSTIFEAINKEKVFPVMFRKMIAICENTGEVGDVLNNVKYFYDQETKDTTEKIVGLIKPITLIVLGGMIAWMGAAMLGPVYMNIANLGEITNPREAY